MGALQKTVLAIQQNTSVDVSTPTVNVYNVFLESSTGGLGAIATLTFTELLGALVYAEVLPGNGGSGYSIGDTITLTVADLNAMDGISGAVGDLILGPLIAGDFLVEPEIINVNGQGEGYAIGNILYVTGSLIGGDGYAENNLTYTLGVR